MLSEVQLYYFWLLIANSAYSLIVYFLECGVLLLLLESILRTRADSVLIKCSHYFINGINTWHFAKSQFKWKVEKLLF